MAAMEVDSGNYETENISDSDQIEFIQLLFRDGGWLSGHTAFENYYWSNNYQQITVKTFHSDFPRFDNITNDVKDYLYNICFDDVKTLGNNLIFWLKTNCWEHGYTHGDLTGDNLLLPWNGNELVPNANIIVIDWFESLSGLDQDNNKNIFKFIIDVYDVINSLGKIIYKGSDYWTKIGEDDNVIINDVELIFGNENMYKLMYDYVKVHEQKANDDDDYSIIDDNWNEVKRILDWLNYSSLLPEHLVDFAYMNGGSGKKNRRKNKRSKTIGKKKTRKSIGKKKTRKSIGKKKRRKKH
jgi:hypothetical protein